MYYIGDAFFLAPLGFVSNRQIKYIAKCAIIKVYNQVD